MLTDRKTLHLDELQDVPTLRVRRRLSQDPRSPGLVRQAL
jgi:hypothetical protein